MIQIPGPSRTWKVNHASDLFGHISNSRNLDFNTPGYLKLARKAMALYSSDVSANFGRVMAIIADSSLYYIVTTSRVFTLTASSNSLSFASLTTTSSPTLSLGSDAVMFNGTPHVSGTTTVGYYNGSWNDIGVTTSSSYPHPLCVDPRRIELAVANGNVLKTYNTSYTLQNTLTIRSEYTIETVRYHNGYYFIGTRSTTGDDAPVYVWSGTGTAATSYRSGSDWVYSMSTNEVSLLILTSAGQLKEWNGGGFTSVAELPVYNTPYSWSKNASGNAPGKCLNRGMFSRGSRTYINLDGSLEISSNEYPGISLVNQPSGLWVFEPSVGLYPKAGYVTETYQALAISSLNSSIFTTATAHGAETGDAVWASSVTNIPALTTGQTYFAIKESSTSFKLALSSADALAGRFITCSGTPSGDTIAFDNLTAVGNTVDVSCGAVYGFTRVRPNGFFASEVLFGGSSIDVDGNTVSALMSLGMGRNVGSFVIARIISSGIMEQWQKVTAFINSLHLDTDKIIVKYRVSHKPGLPTPARYYDTGRATWIDSTSFQILTSAKDVKSASVGDEVYFTQGGGAGYSAHIEEINDNTSTYVYTIDEEIPTVTAGDVSDVTIDNWTLLPTTIDTDSTDTLAKGYAELPTEEQESSWLELKFELRGFDVSIDSTKIISNTTKSA